MHQELSALRSMVDTRSRVSVGGAENLDARLFGTKNGAELENLVVFGEGLRRRSARKAAENQKQPIAVTHLQHEFNVINEMGPRIATFLDLEDRRRSSGICPRRLAALYDPLAAGRSLDDSRQILSPPKAAKRDDLSHTIQAGWTFRMRKGMMILEDWCRKPKEIKTARVRTQEPW